MYVGMGIFGEEYPVLALHRIFYPTKEFCIPRGASAICYDLPSGKDL